MSWMRRCAVSAVGVLFCCVLLPGKNVAAAPRQEYSEAIEPLERFIRHEMTEKELPALSIALVGDGETRYGIGFRLGELNGRRSVGHDGAIYGFATTLRALPDEKLGSWRSRPRTPPTP